jgi:hypothetical protein
MKSTRNLKLKNGTVIPCGTVCAVTFHRSPVCTVQPEVFAACRLRCSSLPVYLADDFTRPTIDELGAVVDDAVCPSVMGEQVEPDGYDQHGSPSWLLALGLI